MDPYLKLDEAFDAESQNWMEHDQLSALHVSHFRDLVRVHNNDHFRPTYELLATKHFELAWWHYMKMRKLINNGPFQPDEEFITFKNSCFANIDWKNVGYNIEKWYIRVPPFC
jgi:hypothetical protein